ncbi:MAG: alpha/beta hydrolase [Planctomycetota bacterium]
MLIRLSCCFLLLSLGGDFLASVGASGERNCVADDGATALSKKKPGVAGHGGKTSRRVMPLWPDGAPGAKGNATGDVPQLILTIADSEAATAGVVILPGGGYRMRAIDHVGYQIADWFKRLGVSSAICTYRVRGEGNQGRGYGHPYPMLDAQRAIQTMRAMSEEWNIDPDRIGVIGFSAGGHLAATVSTHFADMREPEVQRLARTKVADDTVSRASSRPDFSILCYPVISFNAAHTHRGSQKNLLGEGASEELIESLSNEKQITSRTPPTFLFHTGADTVVPVDNSLAYYQGCVAQGVQAELHVFPEGRHGLGLSANLSGPSQWPALCEQWLRRRGIVGEPENITVP